jgi:diacylglycerol kinase (ATP)
MKRWWTAFLSTCGGLWWGFRHETAIREEFLAVLLAVPLSFLVTSSGWVRVALIGSVLILLVVELLNTSIEKLCDHVMREIHPQIKIVKDLGSAAVFGATILAAMVWLVAVADALGG